MSSFTQSLRRIASGIILSPERLEALAKLDPTHIYVENVRAVLGIPAVAARALLELAVRQGSFEKGVEVLCPDSTVAAHARTIEELPAVVVCWEDRDGNYEERTYSSGALKTSSFYVYKSEAM